MTSATAPHQSAAAFDLIRPFAESGDARLRGNAVVALTVLIDSSNSDQSELARDELVRILCAEPGARDYDWQRRFAAISMGAIRELDPRHSNPLGSQVFDRLGKTREPAQQESIARLILTACDHGRQLWPISWPQFWRYTGLAGRPGFWLSVWAALWRASIAWTLLVLGLGLATDLNDLEGLVDEDMTYVFTLIAIASAFVFAIIMKLSVAGHLRPPIRVCVWDTIIAAVVFGLFVPVGALTMLPEGHELLEEAERGALYKLLGLSGAFLVAVIIAALVRGVRWAGALVALEPEAIRNLLSPVAAVGCSVVVCVAAAYLGMNAEFAAATLLIVAPASAVLASLDDWLEEKGPRSLLPINPQVERQWLLPVLAGAAVIGSALFLSWNLQSRPAKPASEVAGPLEVSPEGGEGTARMGRPVSVWIAKEGRYEGKVVPVSSSLSLGLTMTDSAGNLLTSEGDGQEVWPLKAGVYTACVTFRGVGECKSVSPSNLIDHLVWAFGLFDPQPDVTVTFVPAPPPTEPAAQPQQ